MDDVMIEIHLENLDRRVTSIEQVLPTLATKEDLREMGRHLEILIESRGDDIRLLAEAVATMIAKLDAWGPRPS